MENDNSASGTPELLTAQLIANEIMIRALFQTHPNQIQVETYLDRMLYQILAQPYYILNPGKSRELKDAIERIRAPGPAEN